MLVSVCLRRARYYTTTTATHPLLWQLEFREPVSKQHVLMAIVPEEPRVDARRHRASHERRDGGGGADEPCEAGRKQLQPAVREGGCVVRSARAPGRVCDFYCVSEMCDSTGVNVRCDSTGVM